MSCILYKDGEEIRVPATDVAHLLTQGYSASKAKKRRSKKKDSLVEPATDADKD